MDISPKYERKLAETAYTSLLAEFRGKILPADHPITRHVRRVITDILETNNLGTLHSSEPHRQPSSGDDFWAEDPNGAARPQTVDVTPESGGKEWNLLVVNDPKVVNAMAMFGLFPACHFDSPAFIPCIQEILSCSPEYYRYARMNKVLLPSLDMVRPDSSHPSTVSCRATEIGHVGTHLFLFPIHFFANVTTCSCQTRSRTLFFDQNPYLHRLPSPVVFRFWIHKPHQYATA